MDEQGDRGVLMDTQNPEDAAYKTPQPINSYDDLNNIREDLTGNYYLTTDIEIPQGVEWVPIGAQSKDDTDPARFSGILDGRGHAVKGLTITTPKAFKGFFGRIDHGTIKNIEFQDVSITGKAPTGGVAGAMIGSSTVEHVSVTGNITSDSEAGGIAGRVARDANNTDYNKIYDCYVNANIRATRLSTSLDSPSCAGGFVGYIHSNNGNSVARLDIARGYFAGTVRSDQKTNTSGCATGVLGFTDNNRNIRLQDVLVLADEITAATPNYYYSRRLPSAPNNVIEYMSGLYVRNDISLTYYSDKGVGGQIPEGTITAFPDATFRTKSFYTDILNWDFENLWSITEGSYPTFKNTSTDGIVENTVSPDTSDYADVYDIHGRLLTRNQSISSAGDSLNGVYIFKPIEKNSKTYKSLK